jgi:hypothetical protein
MKERKVFMPKHEKIEGDSKLVPGVVGPKLGEAPGLSDVSYVEKYGSKDEKAELKKLRQKVETRRAARPQVTYWICENPKCKAQSRANADFKERSEQEHQPCFKCNSPIRPFPGNEKGYLREMSKKESEQFLKDKAEENRQDNERRKKAGLHARNQERLAAGLEPLTEKEFDEENRRISRIGRR